MRVSISGSHSTGKTTLWKACVKALGDEYGKEFAHIEEVARGVIARGFPLNQDATRDSYYNYILDQLKSERLANQKVVLSDRSLVDLLAYIRTNNSPDIPYYFVEMLEEIIWLEKNYFDLYCYLPIEFGLIVDDVRPGELEYQKEVDNTLVNILDEYNLNYVKITGSVEERKRKIMTLINNGISNF